MTFADILFPCFYFLKHVKPIHDILWIDHIRKIGKAGFN